MDRGRLEAQLRRAAHVQAAEAGVADQLRVQLQEALAEVDARYVLYLYAVVVALTDREGSETCCGRQLHVAAAEGCD